MDSLLHVPSHSVIVFALLWAKEGPLQRSRGIPYLSHCQLNEAVFFLCHCDEWSEEAIS